jgi:AraC-like DNA-binding protein
MASMIRVEPREFLRQPAGQLVAGRTWIHFCAHARLFGVVFFGQPNEADMVALARSLVVELGPGVEAHGSLVDASRLERVDPGAFEVLLAYVREHRAALEARVTRLALVRPQGVEGAVVAGFYPVSGAPYPVQLFEDAAEALAWLGEPGASLAGELAEHASAASGTSPLLAALRALLMRRMVDLTLEDACRALSVSERTLQRRLQDAGTTFQAELGTARLEEAKRRMAVSDAPLTAIALDLGFPSLQHFSAVFRKATGQSPSAWRKTNAAS